MEGLESAKLMTINDTHLGRGHRCHRETMGSQRELAALSHCDVINVSAKVTLFSEWVFKYRRT